ncbi:MAG: hypothetical protein NZM26_04235 [Patescibacteria group bacterium]|nr:hypothetical protein [Patescibacteria group bacterium]
MINKNGFTLIALLFVLLVLVFIFAFLLYVFSKSLVAQNNLQLDRQLIESYEKTNFDNEMIEKENNYSSTISPTNTDQFLSKSRYPVHKGITATVFWVGEPVGNGSSEDNSISAWDDEWLKNYGGYDDPINRNGYYPVGFKPLQNPFYLDLPYNDFDWNGKRKDNAYKVVPWAKEKVWGERESMMKNRWVKISKDGITCYGQIQDAGPYEYDDHEYVFGGKPPKNKLANNAGMDVSPALRDCLKFNGINNAENKVNWQFVDEEDVPDGPWKEIVTTSQVNWK